MKNQTTTLECPRQMVGRIIGKNGETVKALQTYTGATIQIDQSMDPTQVSLSGPPYSLSLALSMVSDIVRGSFKGFALLRQSCRPASSGRLGFNNIQEPRPIYAPGYGLIPASQLYDDRTGVGALFPPNIYGAARSLVDRQIPPLYPTLLPGGRGPNILAVSPDGTIQNGTPYTAGAVVHHSAANLMSVQLQNFNENSPTNSYGPSAAAAAVAAAAAAVTAGNGTGQRHRDPSSFNSNLHAASVGTANLMSAPRVDSSYLLPMPYMGAGGGHEMIESMEDRYNVPSGSHLLQIAGHGSGIQTSGSSLNTKSFY
uniref:K Homology domain-containing protein n=1 Tax=Polytomella parva TaxID=51329 RepID=A0A7S0UW84_9CHLO|mmetsp:Transcript_2426/g.3677  ORF Transcript_2426/g.3677 Transcript_2426/m.3677 type:complete len:313 (+) Transcript_2426:181-1119(+)